MKILQLNLILVALIAVTMAGCRDRAVPSGTAHEHDDEHAEMTGPTNRVDIPPIVRSNLGITFATVERRHVARTVRIPGRFELLPTARREYRLNVGGPGHVELLVDQYDEVEQGQPLLRVRSPHWTALQSDLIAAEQAVALAESELHVAEAIVRETISRLEIVQSRLAALSGAEIRLADLELQAAEIGASLGRVRAERNLAEARLTAARHSRSQAIARTAAVLNVASEANLDREAEAIQRLRSIESIEIIAEAAGIVESLAVTNGSYAEDAALVMTVVNPQRVRFRGSIVQSDLSRISHRSQGLLVPPQSSSASVNEHVEAVVSIGLETSPHQRTIELLALPGTDNHSDWMRPGVSAFLEVVVEGTDRAELAIPRSALMKDGLRHVFFRRDPRDPNAAIRVEADLGPDDGRWVVIRSGLRLGDEVVIGGAYELMLATAQSGGGMKGGHFHPDGTWHADH